MKKALPTQFSSVLKLLMGLGLVLCTCLSLSACSSLASRGEGGARAGRFSEPALRSEVIDSKQFSQVSGVHVLNLAFGDQIRALPEYRKFELQERFQRELEGALDSDFARFTWEEEQGQSKAELTRGFPEATLRFRLLSLKDRSGSRLSSEQGASLFIAAELERPGGELVWRGDFQRRERALTQNIFDINARKELSGSYLGEWSTAGDLLSVAARALLARLMSDHRAVFTKPN